MLFLTACRVPEYHGHGGDIPPGDARDHLRSEIVGLFVAHGAIPSACKNSRKVTPLHMAARYGLVRVAGALLDLGANPNALDIMKETPLYRATNLRYYEATSTILTGGADPNLANRKGYTPLHRATLKGDIDLVRLLLENGANPLLRDVDNKMPIDYSRKEDIAQQLVG